MSTAPAAATVATDDPLRPYGFGLVGTALERLVPAGAPSSLLHRRHGTASWLRLSVGPSQAAVCVWSTEGDICLWLHLAASPVDAAFSPEGLEARDVERHADEQLTFADDRAKFCCPDLPTARWFLDQPAVIAAGRLLNARLATAGRHGDVDAGADVDAPDDPALAPEALAAAAVLAAAPPDLVPAAHLDAGRMDERDRLLRLLVDRLAAAGIEPEATSDPPVDLAWWRHDGTYVVAEVADSPGVDGLARVLDHRRRLADRRPRVEAVLLVPRVDNPHWYGVCASSGVRLLAGPSALEWPLAA
jgi:hypothetical protein